MSVISYGRKFVFGVPARRRIVNLPPGSRVRVRLRQAAFAEAFVRRECSIERFYLLDVDGGWELVMPFGANFRQIREAMER